MTVSHAKQIETLAGRKAVLTRFYGARDPRTVQATRELAAAQLAAACEAARSAGLDRLDVLAVVESGALPREVAA